MHSAGCLSNPLAEIIGWSRSAVDLRDSGVGDSVRAPPGSDRRLDGGPQQRAAVLEGVTLADVVAGTLPPRIQELASSYRHEEVRATPDTTRDK
jgi:hypothetical protein